MRDLDVSQVMRTFRSPLAIPAAQTDGAAPPDWPALVGPSRTAVTWRRFSPASRLLMRCVS
jgi:hypothetical protein